MSQEVFTWVNESQAYFARNKLSNGQFCQVGFYEFACSRSMEYHVVFAVADKKKNLNGYFNEDKNNNLTLKVTGHCGLEALIWCKNMLLAFEKDIIPSVLDDVDEAKIVVYGEDPRRLRCYEYGLSKYGYKMENTMWGWGMVKRFKCGGYE